MKQKFKKLFPVWLTCFWYFQFVKTMWLGKPMNLDVYVLGTTCMFVLLIHYIITVDFES